MFLLILSEWITSDYGVWVSHISLTTTENKNNIGTKKKKKKKKLNFFLYYIHDTVQITHKLTIVFCELISIFQLCLNIFT